MKPVLILHKRRVPFVWTQLVAPSNDTLRCLALIGETNDNTLFGGR